jgi:hypothetical protein
MPVFNREGRFTWQQAKLAKAQIEASASAAKDDDERRRKRVALELAEEWCRTEAPSPISILRECLSACDETAIEALLAGRALIFPAQFRDQVGSFIADVLPGQASEAGLESNGDNTISLSENYSHLVRDFFSRRINFLEVVAAAFNSQLADSNLVEQFFGRIIETNTSYAIAVNIDREGWPELTQAGRPPVAFDEPARDDRGAANKRNR